MEEETRTRNGRRQQIKRKVFPGYLLIEMELERRHLVSCQEHDRCHRLRELGEPAGAAPGARGRQYPRVARRRSAQGEADLVEGRGGRVTVGPFAEFTGSIEEVNLDKEKVKVLFPSSAAILPSSWTSIRSSGSNRLTFAGSTAYNPSAWTNYGVRVIWSAFSTGRLRS